MKIIDVCPFYSPSGGGVRTYIHQKLKIGPRLGHEIVIIAPGDKNRSERLGEKARLITIASPRFPLDRKYWYFDDESALYAVLDHECPDVVEVSSPWRSPMTVARWRGSALRSLVMHADPLSAYAYRWFDPFLERNTIDRRFEPYWNHLRLLGRSFDLTICANHDLARRLQNGGMQGVRVVPFGVETALFSPQHRDPGLRKSLLAHCGLDTKGRLLVGAGRLAPEKRWPMVVEAVTAVSRHMPVGLVLFGDGRERRSILRAIAGNPHVRLFEAVRDRRTFAAILASADGVIHGCEAETFGMVTAEARASGTPVIVPDAGGAADHADAGSDLLYRAGDTLAVASAVRRFCALPIARSPGLAISSHQDHFEALFGCYATLLSGAQAA
ncbi:MAG: glycosyltransferase [Sphingobium sp.]